MSNFVCVCALRILLFHIAFQELKLLQLNFPVVSLGRRSSIKWLLSGWGLPSGTHFGSLMKAQDFSLPSLGYTPCVSADSLRDAGWVCRIGFFSKINARHCVCCCLPFACLNGFSLSYCCLGIKLNKPTQKWFLSRVWLYFITELKAEWGWKRPLDVIWSSPMTQAGLSRTSCPGSSPDTF